MDSYMYMLLACMAVSIPLISCNRQWPVPPKKYDVRPAPDAYCQAGETPFCPTGLPSNTMPRFGPNDTLWVYAMKSPVLESKLLPSVKITQDAIGFHHVQTGLNLTMEWYELYQLFNCTFAHEPDEKNKPELLWCNQGATCAHAGIDENHWRQNGTLVKVSEISGAIFNKFADWVEVDNKTYPIYETWTVVDTTGQNFWFNPVDSSSWVLRAFDEMKNLGGKFNQSVHLSYSKINLISETPEKLGNFTEIFGANSSMGIIQDDLFTFYKHFQKETNYLTLIAHLLEAMRDFLIDDAFFLYYNDIYWRLPLKPPYIDITNYEIPLP